VQVGVEVSSQTSLVINRTFNPPSSMSKWMTLPLYKLRSQEHPSKTAEECHRPQDLRLIKSFNDACG